MEDKSNDSYDVQKSFLCVKVSFVAWFDTLILLWTHHFNPNEHVVYDTMGLLCTLEYTNLTLTFQATRQVIKYSDDGNRRSDNWSMQIRCCSRFQSSFSSMRDDYNYTRKD